jgi:hypothetical protein
VRARLYAPNAWYRQSRDSVAAQTKSMIVRVLLSRIDIVPFGPNEASVSGHLSLSGCGTLPDYRCTPVNKYANLRNGAPRQRVMLAAPAPSLE